MCKNTNNLNPLHTTYVNIKYILCVALNSNWQSLLRVPNIFDSINYRLFYFKRRFFSIVYMEINWENRNWIGFFIPLQKNGKVLGRRILFPCLRLININSSAAAVAANFNTSVHFGQIGHSIVFIENASISCSI